jgi:hydroxypyruvate reductase
VNAFAGNSDGIDGSEENAGALVTPDTLKRARRSNVDLIATLIAHDAYGAFATLGDLVAAAPTRTNTNGVRALLVT